MHPHRGRATLIDIFSINRHCQKAGLKGSIGAATMDLLRKILQDRRFHRLLLVALAGLLAVAVVAWKAGLDPEQAKSAWQAAEAYLAGHPVAFFVCLVVLPGLPVPTSALMFLAGTVWRDNPVFACGACLAALALNMTWTYWLAAGPGRRAVEWLLAHTTIRVPELPRSDHLRLILILRLTPGIPLFLQNYLLGFFRPPFRLYLPVSLVCNGIIACGVVLSGAGIADGNLVPALSGVSLIVLGLVVVRAIRQRLRSKEQGARRREL